MIGGRLTFVAGQIEGGAEIRHTILVNGIEMQLGIEMQSRPSGRAALFHKVRVRLLPKSTICQVIVHFQRYQLNNSTLICKGIKLVKSPFICKVVHSASQNWLCQFRNLWGVNLVKRFTNLGSAHDIAAAATISCTNYVTEKVFRIRLPLPSKLGTGQQLGKEMQCKDFRIGHTYPVNWRCNKAYLCSKLGIEMQSRPSGRHLYSAKSPFIAKVINSPSHCSFSKVSIHQINVYFQRYQMAKSPLICEVIYSTSQIWLRQFQNL
jgi:hypothetical protein